MLRERLFVPALLLVLTVLIVFFPLYFSIQGNKVYIYAILYNYKL
jgi:hypothetical protein